MTIAGRDIGSQHDVVKIVDYVAIVLLGLSMKFVHRSRQDIGLCAGARFHGLVFGWGLLALVWAYLGGGLIVLGGHTRPKMYF